MLGIRSSAELVIHQSRFMIAVMHIINMPFKYVGKYYEKSGGFEFDFINWKEFKKYLDQMPDQEAVKILNLLEKI